MKKIRKPASVLICTVAIIFIACIAVFAAYIGKGYRKGIAITGVNYFRSNCLSTAGISYNINCNGYSQTVTLKNFDLTGSGNSFDTDYIISYYAEDFGVNTEGNGFECYVTPEGGSENMITADSQESMQSMTGRLAGGVDSTATFTFSYRGVGDIDGMEKPKIFITARPTSPVHMADNDKYILGGTIVFGSTLISSSTTAALDEISAGGTSDTAVFVYRVTVNGMPDASQDTFTLRWRPEKFDVWADDGTVLVPGASGYAVTSSLEGETLWYSLVTALEADTEYVYRLFRNYDIIESGDITYDDVWMNADSPDGDEDANGSKMSGYYSGVLSAG